MSLRRTLKEIARHLFHRSGMRRKHAHLKPAGREERFSQIYATGVWTHGDSTLPLSGHNSSLAATIEVRNVLPGLLKDFGSEVLLDVGCGDFTWMQETVLPCKYIGVDIVKSVIADNSAKFGSANTEFHVLDAISDTLPEADIVLCRDALVTLSLEDAQSVIRNILSKKRKILIMTSYRETFFNSDIETGDFRVINLQKPPFRFPKPFLELSDSASPSRRILGFWKTSDLDLARRQGLKK